MGDFGMVNQGHGELARHFFFCTDSQLGEYQRRSSFFFIFLNTTWVILVFQFYSIYRQRTFVFYFDLVGNLKMETLSGLLK